MKIKIKRTETVGVKYLKVSAEVRYWEDATVNGVSDHEGELIPCRVGDCWAPLIDLETGIIKDWPANTIADIHYKVCDAGEYTLLSDDLVEVKSIDGYVPSIMCPEEGGYGDYIIMHIGPDGAIANWSSDDLDEFSDDD